MYVICMDSLHTTTFITISLFTLYVFIDKAGTVESCQFYFIWETCANQRVLHTNISWTLDIDIWP